MDMLIALSPGLSILALLIIATIIGHFINVDKHGSHSNATDLEEVSKIASKGWDCEKSTTASKHLSEIKLRLDMAEVNGDSEWRKNLIRSEISDLQEHVDDLERWEWEEKANKILGQFLDCYQFVTEVEYHDFSNLEEVVKQRNKCVKLWYKYWESIESVSITVYPKQYMVDFMGDCFDPCMHDGQKLKAVLDEAVNKERPEYRRKMKLLKEIADYVYSHDGLMRCELLKKKFDGCSEKEVACCYRILVKQHKIIEMKVGNRYFICLSDKETEKRNKKPAT
jgi:hypothetical protein